MRKESFIPPVGLEVDLTHRKSLGAEHSSSLLRGRIDPVLNVCHINENKSSSGGGLYFIFECLMSQ